MRMQCESYFFDKMHDRIFTIFTKATIFSLDEFPFAIKRNDNVLEASWKEKFLYKSISKAIVH